MRPGLVSFEVGVALLLVWLAVVCLVVVSYFLFRSWRRRHPVRKPPREGSYSEKLARRLGQRRERDASTSRKR